MKELYQAAEMDVINFSMDDVISTSAVTETTVLIPPSIGEDTTRETDPLD